MLKLLAYLNDLTSQLKLVAPDVRANYRIPGLGQVKRLRQGNYLVNADSVTNPRPDSTEIQLRGSSGDVIFG